MAADDSVARLGSLDCLHLHGDASNDHVGWPCALHGSAFEPPGSLRDASVRGDDARRRHRVHQAVIRPLVLRRADVHRQRIKPEGTHIARGGIAIARRSSRTRAVILNPLTASVFVDVRRCRATDPAASGTSASLAGYRSLGSPLSHSSRMSLAARTLVITTSHGSTKTWG